ncbi:predicted protein [Histoplasma mississippiense (nom. inval.)]|uniref:predicted protein n=1 Tax=Ajellomyces capsulatus (strain NAm1 / WU24) TaxID=2059318 RepID=UPI000157BC13|nr:predicted protein [Histoplasma mississippiense (nom. inval.)]EDN05855.1 predicted protein [Histoplasma mississippiense (nom. inval.)]
MFFAPYVGTYLKAQLSISKRTTIKNLFGAIRHPYLQRESSTSENNLDIMDQHSKMADNNNGMNNQHRDLTKATTPHRAEKEADKNKILLDNDAKSPFSENISKASKKQETGKGSLLASAPAKRPEPVLHLRGGGCVASSVVNRMAPNRHPDDNERPTKLLWYMIEFGFCEYDVVELFPSVILSSFSFSRGKRSMLQKIRLHPTYTLGTFQGSILKREPTPNGLCRYPGIILDTSKQTKRRRGVGRVELAFACYMRQLLKRMSSVFHRQRHSGHLYLRALWNMLLEDASQIDMRAYNYDGAFPTRNKFAAARVKRKGRYPQLRK